MFSDQDNEREEPEPTVIDGYTLLDRFTAAKVDDNGALIFRAYHTDGPDEDGEPVYRLGGVVGGIWVDGLPALRRLLEAADSEGAK